MFVILFWQYLACVVPYGEPIQSSYLTIEGEARVVDFRRWDELDAQLVSILEFEEDRDRIQRLELARQLLQDSRTLSPRSQEKILLYVEQLLVIEARYGPRSIVESSEPGAGEDSR